MIKIPNIFSCLFLNIIYMGSFEDYIIFLKTWLLCFHSVDGVGLNLTNTFLVFTEEDIGDLLKISLRWEGPSDSWSSVVKYLKSSIWSWSSSQNKKVLEVRRIRIKAGETQKK